MTIAADINNGTLVGGHRLPTHRDLAEQLGVSVKTVTRAYAELNRSGLVEAVVGRGSFVRAPSGVNHLHARGKAGIDLLSHMGLTAPLQDLFRPLLQSVAKGDTLNQILMYQPVGGTVRHRQAGAQWAGLRGVAAETDNTIVCAGTQHAVFTGLLALTKRGDTIATECLAYPGVKAAADQLGLRILGLPIDDEGLVPEALDELCRHRHPPAVVVFTPTSHNPTLATAGATRRSAIASVLAHHGVSFIEDDIFGHVVPAVAAPVASMLPEQGLYVCGTSKAMAPGLRTSFIVSPRALVDRLKAAVYGNLFAAPALPVELATQGILSGAAQRMIEWHRKESNARIRILRDCLRDFDIRTVSGVYLAWMRTPAGVGDEELTRRLGENGVLVAPDRAFATVSGRGGSGIRLSLASNTSRQDLRRGAEIIGRVCRNIPDDDY